MQRMLTSDTVSFCRDQILSEISWLLLTDRHDDGNTEIITVLKKTAPIVGAPKFNPPCWVPA